jgi:N-acetylglucosaminyldiphosphoundecaprenol N-acetyl-beta-D-mannosaminyltransferase
VKCAFGPILIDNVTMDEAVEAIVRMAQKTEIPRIVCTANLDHLATAHHDVKFRSIYETADFVVADGMPLIWLSSFGTCKLKQRVAGSDLLWELSRASGRTGVRIFFLGGQPGAAVDAKIAVLKQYPDANIVGTYCPPYGTLDDPIELKNIREAVAAATPDILLVGFGSPKQEKWISQYKEMLNVPVNIGVGGSFDMTAGIVKRAPLWMQSAGFEWVFRLKQEPRRLWHRYFGKDLPFFGKLFAALVTERLQNALASSIRRGPIP